MTGFDTLLVAFVSSGAFASVVTIIFNRSKTKNEASSIATDSQVKWNQSVLDYAESVRNDLTAVKQELLSANKKIAATLEENLELKKHIQALEFQNKAFERKIKLLEEENAKMKVTIEKIKTKNAKNSHRHSQRNAGSHKRIQGDK